MICPKCKKKISYVNVFSECRQRGDLKKGTNEIEDYGSIEEITETTDVECPECSASLINDVEL